MTAASTGKDSISRLILASASPRRQSLLREAGYAFVVHPANINEAAFSSPLPATLARDIALAKAKTVAEQFPADVILAADTVVAFGDQPLGKPADADHARRMLQLLEGTTHIVITAVTVIRLRDHLQKNACVFSAVRMKPLSPAQIDDYVATNDWQRKAGGYGIQDPDPFVQRLSGCHTNIVGLPMTTTTEILDSLGIFPAAQVPPAEAAS